jgi:tetratricopeptide (TPR) repeat protein
MTSLTHWIRAGLVVLLATLSMVATGNAQLKPGEPAPLFQLKDASGKGYDLSDLKEQPMAVLYFFDVKSKSSQEGLMNLDELTKKYKQSDLTVWAVTRSDKPMVVDFIKQQQISFPVLLDGGTISDSYHARLILPTVCIVGPDLKLLDYFQGGGKATETLLVTLAERELQRRNTDMAKALSDKVTEKDPKNARAQTVKGYAEMKEGDLKAAEKTFYGLSRTQGEGEILGKEGLSQVYAQKGEPAKAMQIAEEVESKSGQRASAHVVKGDLLYSQNKPAEAEKEYRKAIEKSGSETTSRAVAYNQLGRIYAIGGDYAQSRKMYDQAVTLDPYYVEATSNKGLTYERQGEWAKALESYRRAQAINRNDPFAAALAAHAQRMMLLEKDPDLKLQFERQIQDVVERYKEGTPTEPLNATDPWTSGTTVLAMLEPVEIGGLATRDGFARVLNLQISDSMKSSGRIEIIEPIMLERVTKALKLSAKDLQNPDTQQRLAQAFGARLLVKGTLFHLSESTMLKLKLEDVADNQIADTIEHQFASAVTLQKDLHWLNRELLTAIMTHYPLKAFVVEVTGNQVLLNLGKNQGVVNGTLFDVVEEKPMVDFKGKQFKPEPAVMATVEVVRVEDDFAYAHIKDSRRPVKAEDKLRESVSQMIGGDQKTW